MSHTKELFQYPDSRTVRNERKVRHQARSLNVTEEELRRVIEKVGTSAKKVIAYLRSHR
jgi:hypothetical protein